MLAKHCLQAFIVAKKSSVRRQNSFFELKIVPKRHTDPRIALLFPSGKVSSWIAVVSSVIRYLALQAFGYMYAEFLCRRIS